VRLIKALSLGLSLASLLIFVTAVRAESAADARGDDGSENIVEGQVQAGPQVPWRNSAFLWSHYLSALSFSKTTDLTYNPYYAQSLSFRPRYYPLKDLYVGARLDLEVELTLSDETDRSREWVVSDLLIDAVYAPDFLTIPILKIKASPSLRLTFPTSIVSRARTLVMGLGPGFSLKREIPLLKKKFLTNLELMYAFRGTKYFNEYTEASIDVSTCANFARPECQHTGKRNAAARFSNFFEAKLQILEKLSFSASLTVINDTVYSLSAQTVSTPSSPDISFPGDSGVNMRGALWGIWDLSYDPLDWLTVSFGISTYHPMLTPTADSYYGPWFNRYTQFYLEAGITIDKLVSQVQGWTGWGRKKNKSSDMVRADR
jgi:hypothetical protein